MTTTTRPVRCGTTSARILSPDVARGLALLGIAMANIPTAWVGFDAEGPRASFGDFAPEGLGVPRILDQIAIIFSAMFVHVRGLPMFTMLLGFGIGLISMSLQRRNFPRAAAWKVLVRRYGFLALFGAIHCVFLFFGDIMLMYGLLGMILALMIGLSNKVLLWIAGVLYSLQVIVGVAMTIFIDPAMMAGGFPMDMPQTYLGYVGFGAMMIFNYVIGTIFASFSLLPLMILGLVFARSRVLHEPEKHLRLLWSWLIVGAIVVFGIGLPWGIAAAFGNDDLAATMNMLNGVFGYLTGPATIALVALVLRGPQKKYEETGKVPTWLAAPVALGKRSMSGYLMQSIILFTLTLPFTLHMFQDVGAFWLLVLAFAVWLTTLILAYILELAGIQGPFEWLHRRLSYGKNGLPKMYQPKVLPQPEAVEGQPGVPGKTGVPVNPARPEQTDQPGQVAPPAPPVPPAQPER